MPSRSCRSINRSSVDKSRPVAEKVDSNDGDALGRLCGGASQGLRDQSRSGGMDPSLSSEVRVSRPVDGCFFAIRSTAWEPLPHPPLTSYTFALPRPATPCRALPRAARAVRPSRKWKTPDFQGPSRCRPIDALAVRCFVAVVPRIGSEPTLCLHRSRLET